MTFIDSNVKNTKIRRATLDLYQLFSDISQDLLYITKIVENNRWITNIDVVTKNILVERRYKYLLCQLHNRYNEDILSADVNKVLFNRIEYCLNKLKKNKSLYLKSLFIDSILKKMPYSCKISCK